ncbi:MAG: M56 family metallopeptidase [Vicinamibacterales bacterium]
MSPSMNQWVHVAGWALVHFVWQGALVALLTAAALRLLRHGSANARYLTSCIALGAMLLAPIVTARLLSTPAPAERNVNVAPLEFSSTFSEGGRALFFNRETPAPPFAASMDEARRIVTRSLPVVIAVWLVGVSSLLIRLAGGWWRVRRLHQASLALVASSWQTAGDQLATRLGVHRVVHIVDSLLIDTPTVVGWLRPVILLPIAALANLTPAQVEAILAHELAHIRRHDYLVNLIQTMAETLLFYHPAVWWVSARIRSEREHCCDAVAVEACGDAVGYAAALTELESARTGRPFPAGQAALALAATGGSLLERVRRVLRMPVDDVRPARTEAIPAIMTAALVLLFVVGAAGLRRQPGLQASSAPESEVDRSLALIAPHLGPNLIPRHRGGAEQVRETVIVRVERQRSGVPVQTSSTLVSGTITDPTGAGVSDAAVVLTDIGAGPSQNARTDESGHFEFVGLPIGQYLIGVTAPGLEPFHDRLTVIPGARMQLDVRLQILAVAISTSAGRPGPAQGPQGRPAMPSGWICVDDAPRAAADVGGRVGPGLCGPPSLVQELERDLKAQQEAFHKQGAKPAFMSMAAMAPVRYPQDLWDAMIEGGVVLEGRVGTDGSAIGLRSVAPVHPGLAKAALETVSQWRFEPARLHDVAVEVPLKVTINFRLHN